MMIGVHDPVRMDPDRVNTVWRYWLFAGWMGAHRFYAGHYLSGCLQLSLALVAGLLLDRSFWPALLLLAWWMADVRFLRQCAMTPAQRELALIPIEERELLSLSLNRFNLALRGRDYSRGQALCREAFGVLAEIGLTDSIAAARWHAREAECLRRLGRTDEALPPLNLAAGMLERLGDDEGLCDCLFSLARARQAQGQRAEAESALRRLLEKQVLARKPAQERLEARFFLAELYLDNRHPEEALTIFRDLAQPTHDAEADPSARVRAVLGEGRALAALSLLDEARARFARVLERFRNDPERDPESQSECRRGLGMILLREGNTQAADTELTAALALREKFRPLRLRPEGREEVGFTTGELAEEPPEAHLIATAGILNALVRVSLMSGQSGRGVRLAGYWAAVLARLHGAQHPVSLRAQARVDWLRSRLGVRESCVGASWTESGTRANNRRPRAIRSIRTLDGAMHLAERITGEPRLPFSVRGGGSDRYEAARSVLVRKAQAAFGLQRLRELLPPQFQVFIGTTRWLPGTQCENWVELVVVPSSSGLDCVRVADTSGGGLSNAALLNRLHAWDMYYGVDILSAESDEIGFRLMEPPADTARFYRELRSLCPTLGATIRDVAELEAILADPARLLRMRWLPDAPSDRDLPGCASAA